MGRTLEKVKVQNFGDLFNATQGDLDASQVRTAEIEAVVDTGATYLCLPPNVIEQLGLLYARTQTVTTANGPAERRFFKGADITIKDRNIQMAVMENDEATPPLVGYLILEALDFVVDPKANRLIPNPEHDGKWIADLL